MRGNRLDEGDVKGLLVRRVREAGGQRAFCKQVRERHSVTISETYLSEVMAGHKPVGTRVWQALNLRCVRAWEPLDDEPPARGVSHAHPA